VMAPKGCSAKYRRYQRVVFRRLYTQVVTHSSKNIVRDPVSRRPS
jgi:hypothetical protein